MGNFYPISRHISEMVQGRTIVAISWLHLRNPHE